MTREEITAVLFEGGAFAAERSSYVADQIGRCGIRVRSSRVENLEAFAEFRDRVIRATGPTAAAAIDALAGRTEKEQMQPCPQSFRAWLLDRGLLPAGWGGCGESD